MAGAVLIASTAEHDASLGPAIAEGGPILDELAETSRRAYRELVHDDPGFAAFFRDVTPIAELSNLRLGSRPAARGRQAREAPPSIDSLRAIPWTFAWSQSRINLPGWYGLGLALEAYRTAHGEAGLDVLARLYRSWPFLNSLLDNAELSLVKADVGVARLYARLATNDGDDRRWATIEAEHARAVQFLLRVTGRDRLLDDAPGAPALDHAAQPVRRLALGAPGAVARPAPLAGTRRSRARNRPPARPADRQWGRGRTAEHRIRERMDHADHVGLLRAGLDRHRRR